MKKEKKPRETSSITEAKFRHEVKKSPEQRGGRAKSGKTKESGNEGVEMFNPKKYQNWLA